MWNSGHYIEVVVTDIYSCALSIHHLLECFTGGYIVLVRL